jgi:hypothetical protein
MLRVSSSRALLGCALATVALSGAACQTAATAPPVTAAAEPAPQAPAAAAVSEEAPEPEAAPLETGSLLDPPDGVWLRDDQGRDYWVLEVPKFEGHYLWMDEEKTKVKLHGGGIVDVESYDDRIFRVKIYRVEAASAPAAQRGPTAQDRAALEASYRADLPQSDRLAFEPFRRGLPSSGQWRNGFVVLDVDGNGTMDIVHGPPRKGDGRPVVFLGDGDGSWRRAALTLPGRLDYGDVAVADLDQDGILDLVFGCHLLGITAYRGLGGGRYELFADGLTLVEENAGTPAFASRTIELADWDGDGRLDLIALGEGPQLAMSRDVPNPEEFVAGSRGIRIFLNPRDGVWRELAVPPSRVYGSALLVRDLDNDGDLDAVFGSDSGGNTQLILRGRGAEAPELIGLQGLRPGAVVRSVAAADFSGDGLLDVVVSYTTRELGEWRSGLDLLVQGPNLSFNRHPLWSKPGRNHEVHALATGDVDADGRPDVVAIGDNGLALLLLGDRRGLVQEAAPELFVEGGCRGYAVHLADLDGQPGDEIVAAYAGDPSSPNPMALAAGIEATCKESGSLQAWRATGRPEAARPGS